jgi:lysophospholipase L1-like esterase
VIKARTGVYLALSALVALPAFLEAFLRLTDSTFWIAQVCAQSLLWSSWPRYRSTCLRAATLGFSAIPLLNLVATAGIGLMVGERSPTAEPNRNVRLHYVGAGVLPGVAVNQVVTTNSQGHRTNGPIDYARKPAGTIRVVAIGASTTEEATLDDRKTWTFLTSGTLQAATGRKIELINTALGGARAEQNYLALVEAEEYTPDIVLFLMGINDWNFAIAEKHSPAAYQMGRKIPELRFSNSPLYRGVRELRKALLQALFRAGYGAEVEVLEVDRTYTEGFDNSLDRPMKVQFRPRTVDANYAAWAGRIFDECKAKHLFCLFMDQPTAYSTATPPEMRKRLHMTPPWSSYTLGMDDMISLSHLYNDWMAQEATRRGLAFCPLAGKFPPTTDYFTDDCHFNENGARRVAEVVASCLLGHRTEWEGRHAGR